VWQSHPKCHCKEHSGLILIVIARSEATRQSLKMENLLT
jgi:hypothetical protein